MPVVTVADYGVGNLLSVARAFERCGATVVLTAEPAAIAGADYLVLPGVGAFADGMSGLRQRGLIEPIREFAARGRPFLGICLGMQMMLTSSEEFGSTRGLDLIAGTVVPIPATGSDGRAHKIPHIGWNAIEPPRCGAWQGTPLADTPPGTEMYFVHSFTAVPESAEHRLADASYNGRVVSAAIRSGNLCGCQFHPEKSGAAGLRLLVTFLAL